MKVCLTNTVKCGILKNLRGDFSMESYRKIIAKNIKSRKKKISKSIA